jgi:O-antigen/teichoic acid export membrane protein
MSLAIRSQVFAGALSRTLFPRMSSVNQDEARSLASRALVSLAYGYGAICAPAIILAPAFFKYWIGLDFAKVAAPVAEILFFGAWINGLAFVPFGLLQSQGRPDVPGKFHAAELLPFVGVLWGLTTAYGIAGAALAWSLRCAADAICLFWAARLADPALGKTLLIPLLLLLGSGAIAQHTAFDLSAAITAATIVGLVSAILAVVMARDLAVLLMSAIRRIADLYSA